jgi:hypothetical protein
VKTRRGVEICRVGKYRLTSGEHTFTKAQLESAVRRASAGQAPRIGIGHTDPRWAELAAGDGEPALGRVENLRLSDDGSTLIGDFARMPDWFADALPTAFPSRSIEGPCDGDELQISAVKVLGLTMPGVHTLADLEQFVSDEGPALVAAGADNHGHDVTVVLASQRSKEKPMDKKRIRKALGLPADATDDQVKDAAHRFLAEDGQAKVSEREDLLAAAVDAGKFSEGRVAFWREQYDRDPAGARKAIGSLVAVGREKLAASARVARTAPQDALYSQTRQALGLEPRTSTPRAPVAAAAASTPTAPHLARTPDGEVVWGGAPTRLSDRGTRQIFHRSDWVDVEEAERMGVTPTESVLSIHAAQSVGSAATRSTLQKGLNPLGRLMEGSGTVRSAGRTR